VAAGAELPRVHPTAAGRTSAAPPTTAGRSSLARPHRRPGRAPPRVEVMKVIIYLLSRSLNDRSLKSQRVNARYNGFGVFRFSPGWNR
jgi:hypothetical protein